MVSLSVFDSPGGTDITCSWLPTAMDGTGGPAVTLVLNGATVNSGPTLVGPAPIMESDFVGNTTCPFLAPLRTTAFPGISNNIGLRTRV